MMIFKKQAGIMKTTSYELSKKLAEIGFKAESQCGYTKKEGSFVTEFDSYGYDYPAYGLETILKALPSNISLIKGDLGDSVIYKNNICVNRMQSESLADAAARMLLILHENNILQEDCQICGLQLREIPTAPNGEAHRKP